MIKTKLIQISLLAALASTGSILAQVKAQPETFVLDPIRPFVYLKFDHFGPGEPWATDDVPFRLWFKLVSNCNVTIQVRTFGGLDHALGVMDEVIQNEKLLMIVSESEPEPKLNPISEPISGTTSAGVSSQSASTDANRTTKSEAPMPSGYWGELSSSLDLTPGKEVLFSLPVNHLSTRWHFEIPFTFKVPAGHCCRAEEVGGEPEMSLRYDLADLPDKIQEKIKEF
jgi:hypothetical protein